MLELFGDLLRVQLTRTNGARRSCPRLPPSAQAATLVAMHARRRRFVFRALGAGALLAIVAASITDVAATRFWDNNAMLTGVLADVLVLLVGVVVVNEWLDIRANERWRTLAYYALVELMYSSRTTWVRLCHELDVHGGRAATIAELADRLHADDALSDLDERAQRALADPVARRRLADVVVELSEETRETLTDWVPIMITTAPSANAINRFTHLHGRLMRLRHVLQETIEGHRIPNIEIGDDAWAALRIATIIRLGARLAEAFRAEALQLMPPEDWSDERFARV